MSEFYIPGDLVRCARGVAIRAHTDCNQHYGDLPYVAHLADVASNAIAFIDLVDERHQDIVVAAAWLHDVLEDTHTTYNDLVKQLAPPFQNHEVKDVAEIVYALTNNKGRTRDERADDAYYTALRLDMRAVYVKLCDRLANVQNAGSMVERYRKEYPAFRSNLYFDGLEPMWFELDRLLKP